MNSNIYCDRNHFNHICDQEKITLDSSFPVKITFEEQSINFNGSVPSYS